MENAKPQSAHIEQRKKISVTGVESVDAFSPTQISLTIEGGTATIGGENLKIVSFDKATGSFCAEGKVGGIRFHEKGEKLARRLFG